MEGAAEAQAQSPQGLLRLKAFTKGPRLQLINLLTFFVVVNLTLDYPNPIPFVAIAVGTAGALDAVASRWRFGEWRIPWPTLVGALGICLVVDGIAWTTFALLGGLMVAGKHLIRWRGRHLFNPNNLASAILLVAGLVRVGVNDWGAAPQALLLMLLFGTIATLRVDRFDLAVEYIGLSLAAYAFVAFAQGWGPATVVAFALSPLQVMIGFFAITDPATSPSGRLEKLLFACLLVLLAVPATLAGRPEAPIFALLAAAPQRHAIAWLVRRRATEPTAVPA